MANNIREIITKAIISKGKKRSINKYTFEIDDISNVLGCWICNHHFDATIKENKPVVLGTYDLHIWYSSDGGIDSMVKKKQITYMDELDVTKKDERDFIGEDEIEANCYKQPKCIKVENNLDGIVVEIEKEMAVSIIGKTCLRVETKNEKETWDEMDPMDINKNFIK